MYLNDMYLFLLYWKSESPKTEEGSPKVKVLKPGPLSNLSLYALRNTKSHVKRQKEKEE